MAMHFRQRQETQAAAIEGKRVNNLVTCNLKEVRTLSPQIIEMVVREETFETDSFRQILTKRSVSALNKENVSCNAKKLRKIKEEPDRSKSGGKARPKSRKSLEVKSSTNSLHRLLKKHQPNQHSKGKQRKSISPAKQYKNYRSGPSEKRAAVVSINQYVSINTQSKTSREGIGHSKSERNLTDRMKATNKNQKKKEQKQKSETQPHKKNHKKRKNVSKANLLVHNLKRPPSALTRTESLAKQFDNLIKCPSKKNQSKEQSQNLKKSTSRGKIKNQKGKKVLISNNNSKGPIERIKIPSDFSEDSRESPEKMMLSKYHHDNKVRNKKRDRLSFEPVKKKGKKQKNIKTEIVEPEKNLMGQHEAAKMIQKVFRGYITRKYIAEFKQVMGAVIKIQRCWRGYRDRKRVIEMGRKNKQKSLQINKFQRIEQLFKENNRSIELTSLLEDILHEENVNSKIKQKISDFLKKEGKVSSRSSISVRSHNQQQIKSEKRFFEQMERKKYQMNSPVIKCSPRLDKSELQKSPEIMLENLLTIQQFHRQKLINNANMQRQGLERLAMRNIFSPKTHDMKKKQIQSKLVEDLRKFDTNISEIIQSCKRSDDSVGPVKPFSGISTPEKSHHEEKLTNSDKSQKIEPINSERRGQDLSVQLLEYYEQKTQHNKTQSIYEPFDSSYQFIEEYLLNLFEYLRQGGQDFRLEVIKTMKDNKNLQVGIILKNMNSVTEDSQDDICFKLPMYKYLEQQEKQIISRQMSEEFNQYFTKLQRHQLSYQHKNLEDMYIKMLIDCINEALNLQRPSTYLFTETALSSKKDGIRLKEIQALESEDCSKTEAQFSFYFAKGMNQIYHWAHHQCGNVATEQAEQEAVNELNQKKLKQYLKLQAETRWECYDQLLQVIVGVADSIFDQLVMEEGISLYY